MWSNMEPEVVAGICQAMERIYQNRMALQERLAA